MKYSINTTVIDHNQSREISLQRGLINSPSQTNYAAKMTIIEKKKFPPRTCDNLIF